jgi:anti-anti-sigma factor
VPCSDSFSVTAPSGRYTLSDAGSMTSDSRPADIWLSGDHDLSTFQGLQASLAGVVAPGGTDVVMDLSGVTFFSAAALGAIVRARGELARHGRALFLCSPSDAVRRTFELCNVDLNDLQQADASRHNAGPETRCCCGGVTDAEAS